MSVNVLLSLAPPDGTTRYVVQLTEGKACNTYYRYFSWVTALFGRYQVFHVHWPEQLIRSRGLFPRIIKGLLFRLLLLKIKIFNIAVVRTLHNLHPHETGNDAETRLLSKLDRLTSLYIRLNAATPMDATKGVTILHGHYINRYPGAHIAPSERGRILYFGLIRPYKGIERLLEVFRSLDDNTLSLRVVGRPTRELGDLIKSASEDDSRITGLLEFVADDVLATEVYKSELVILPYKEMHNSGAILVALSLNRPVLVPRSSSNELLSAEVGKGWVIMYDGELTKDLVINALIQIRSEERSKTPTLGGRDWSVVGEKHYEAYMKAIEMSKR